VQPTWFDEVYAEDGVPRSAFAALRHRIGRDPLRPSVAAAERLRDQPLGDDCRILPIPMVIDDVEYRSVIKAGVAQRARALQSLFSDLVLGQQRILTAGLGFGQDLIDDILAMDGITLDDLRTLWQEAGRERIRFVYGPDLIRGPDGRWVVLEDNVGCVGGTADSFFVAHSYQEAMAQLGPSDGPPPADLAVAIRHWLSIAGPENADAAVAVLGCAGCADPRTLRLDENARRCQILSQLGIPVVDRHQLAGAGMVVNFDVDMSWSDLFVVPGATLLNAPGTGMLGNKALLPYLDDAICFYTGAPPILPTPDTRLVADGALPADPKQWVMKTAAGAQGTEVIVLGRLGHDQLGEVAARMRTNWAGAAAVLQRYVEPSRLSPAGPGGWDSYRVEIRAVAYVLGWNDIYVSEQPVGKAVSDYDARRLNNISQGACYLPVLREPGLSRER
jgi:carboxylate-amine ligase